MEKIILGISSCLLGNPVRYDGGHQLDRFVRDTLGEYVEYLPVCPETECGLGIPRETMRLEGEPGAVRLVTSRTRVDHTQRMLEWAMGKVRELERAGLCGFIFKGGSPSSGMERVKLYDANGVPRKIGVGMFAAAFMEHFPLLPVEEDGRLHDPVLRENFIERIFVYQRWRQLIAAGKRIGPLVAFHTRHKLLVMSHSPKHYTEMGKLVAAARELDPDTLYDRYQRQLMEALKLRQTLKKNGNVLQHLLGYFKKDLTADEKQELLEVIQQYREGHVPLIVPITLVRHYVRKYDQPYLKDQVYLNPHPTELRLRNHV